MHDVGTMPERKREQLEICAQPTLYPVETSERGSRFDEIHLVHRALPELSVDEVDPGVDFLGRRSALPIFISCMTGGSRELSAINRELALAAQSAGIAVGSGSLRVLFRHPEFADQFRLRTWAPDVAHIANIGAVQLREVGIPAVVELAKRVEADALAVHLNPGQELFQEQGDRDFRGLSETLLRLFEESSLPVIVKETGFGMAPFELRRLLEGGAAYVDLAGSGGTNWIAVESHRLGSSAQREAAGEFSDWGYPTALLLAALNDRSGRVLASGGIRSGLDVVKSLALGARLAGLALPFARLALERGAEGVGEGIAALATTIRAAMLLTGSRNAEDLGRGRFWMEGPFAAEAAALAAVAP